MHAQTTAWLQRIDALTNDFKKAFGHLTANQLYRKPDSETWSVAENLEHLIKINETYYPVVAAVRAGTYRTPFLARFGFFTRWMGNMILKAVQPDRQRKMKTFAIWEPTVPIAADTTTLWQRFEVHQAALKQFIADNEDLVLSNTVIASPANPNIVYTLGKAFDIIVTHEARHLEQARALGLFKV